MTFCNGIKQKKVRSSHSFFPFDWESAVGYFRVESTADAQWSRLKSRPCFSFDLPAGVGN